MKAKEHETVVWITGASSGIGLALAKACHSKGMFVIASARSTDKLHQLQGELGERLFPLPLDLNQYTHAPEWVERALNWQGRIDILVNNGGMGHMGTALDMPLEVEEHVMNVNFWGAVALTKALLPRLQQQGNGQIWTVASILGYFGSPKLAAYSASKFAVIGYFESLQYELRGTPVHVGLLSPGFVNTNVTLSSLGPDGQPIKTNSTAQENGMAPERLAARLVREMSRRRPRKHLFIGGYELGAVWFKRFLPTLFFTVYGKLTDITREAK